jgi:predicted PurR-regulated permease PerM
MLERLSPSARNLVLAVLAVLVIWFLWTVRTVLNPLLLGYLLAFVLHPFVLRLERRGFSRRAAANVIFTLFVVSFVLLAGAIYWQGNSLFKATFQERGILTKIEGGIQTGINELRARLPHLDFFAPEPAETEPIPPGEPDESVGEGTPAEGGEIAVDEGGPATVAEGEGLGLAEIANRMLAWLTEEDSLGRVGEAGIDLAGFLWRRFRNLFGSIVAFLTLVLLLPIYAYFLLFELDRIHVFVRRYLPIRDRDRIAGMARQIGEMLETFFRGRLLVCFLKGLFLTLGLLVVNVPYAFLIGMGSGLMSLVPFFGAFLGFVLAILLGLLEHSLLGGAWRAGLVFGLAELVEGYILLPHILGDSMGLHPVVVLAAVMIGAAALGMFGALIALPLAAAVIIVAREMLLPALAAFADEKAETGELRRGRIKSPAEQR